ncbi:MAG: hypothetical protein AAGE85_04380 [Pseudomonadota bacterium]
MGEALRANGYPRLDGDRRQRRRQQRFNICAKNEVVIALELQANGTDFVQFGRRVLELMRRKRHL